MKFFTVIIFSIILLGCTSTHTPHEKLDSHPSDFDGVWTGNLQQIKGIGYPFVSKGLFDTGLMLVIHDNNIKVFTVSKSNDLSEVKPGYFKIIKYKTNAIIYAQNSGDGDPENNDGIDWVETWNITLTHKNESSAYTYLVRAVNNFKLPAETDTKAEQGRFFYSYSGELKKVADIETKK